MWRPRLVKPIFGLLSVAGLFLYLLVLIVTLHPDQTIRETVEQYWSNGRQGFFIVSCLLVSGCGADIGAILYNMMVGQDVLTTAKIGPDDGGSKVWSEETKLEKVYPIIICFLMVMWFGALIANSGFTATYDVDLDVNIRR